MVTHGFRIFIYGYTIQVDFYDVPSPHGFTWVSIYKIHSRDLLKLFTYVHEDKIFLYDISLGDNQNPEGGGCGGTVKNLYQRT